MSNWVAEEWAKFKAWLTKEHNAVKSDVESLKSRVALLESKLQNEPALKIDYQQESHG